MSRKESLKGSQMKGGERWPKRMLEWEQAAKQRRRPTVRWIEGDLLEHRVGLLHRRL